MLYPSAILSIRFSFPRGSPTAESDFQISAWLAAEGRDGKIPMEFKLLSGQKQEETEILFLEFKVHELRPGRYSLHILAEDPAAKSSSETKSELLVIVG